MLAIARGLMGSPTMLMLDEPSLGLSPLLINDIYKVLQELNQQGLTLLLAEQNVRKSLTVSRFTYVIEEGRIVLSGESGQLAQDDRVKKAYLGVV